MNPSERSPIEAEEAPAGSRAALLDPDQDRAVSFGEGPLLVVAGAGSGKTRVLTHRVAHLIVSAGVPAHAILAFTFTNKAAREMKARLARLLGPAIERLWVGTFHGTCLRILRREAHRFGFPTRFTVFDREDQVSLLSQVLRDLDLRGAGLKPAFFLARVSGAKNALVSPDEYEATAVTPPERQAARVYRVYQESLTRQAALDFDDLIARVVWLLENDAEVRERYAGRFHHVLVDEYQDTNHAQFRLVAALASAHRNLLAVGDEDQSIYGWRGADLANVLDFERRFPGAQVIRLDRNYRSTGTIVEAASAVVANNRLRRDKRLWTDHAPGTPIRLILSGDEEAEASRLAEEVLRQTAAGRSRSDCAVLFRTNAQSRALELGFRHRGVPYELVGGVSFFERREVKDLLAYLRLTVNPRDRVSFLRVLNVPKRGLGDQARARIEARLAATADTPPEALAGLARSGELPRAGAAGAAALAELLRELAAAREEPASTLLDRVIDRTRYLDYLDDAFPEDAEDRRENVEELVHAARRYEAEHPEARADEFLNEAALVADVDRWSESDERAVLMTAHNAKGLEFPVVMVAGCEEGVFPHFSSFDEEAELEEERRLFYVALTRARDEVIVSAAAFRRRYDDGGAGELSRFVREIPSELLVVENPPGWSRSSGDPVVARGARNPSREPAREHEAVGRLVYHPSFGRGTVVDAEGQGPATKFTVRFPGVGLKKVLGRYLTPDD